MSHLRRAEGYEQEQTSSEDDSAARNLHSKKRRLMETDEHIGNIVGITISSDSEDEDIQEVTGQQLHSDKLKAGVKVEWSDDDDNTYEKFKNRAADKRKRTAAVKKKVKAKVKDAVVGRKIAKEKGEPAEKEKKTWGGDSDYEMMEDSLPEYLQRRKQKFDRKMEKLKQADLSLPPNYDDIDFSDDERLSDLQERPEFPDTIRHSQKYNDVPLLHSLGLIPAPIAQYLRDYQIEGVSFLHELFVYQKGGILGDDMGLGKTVQVAAFLSAAFGKTGDERDAKRMRKMRRAGKWYPRALVICPGSLIENWKQELARWGWWQVGSFHGDGKEEVLAAATAGRLEVMITTYQTYKMHRDRINLIEWDCVIADECHQLKERTSETTRAMNEVNALCRIGLTGTAIQNKYEELWTLLNWTNPGRFGPLSTWKSSISDPLRIGQSHDATVHQLSQARKTAKKLVENLLPQFFLRRMKSLIAHQLPKKSDRVVFCPMTELQRDAYEHFLDSPMIELVKYSAEACDCGSEKKRGWCCYKYTATGEKWQVLVFPVIGLLQKLSNHLALLIPNSTDHHDKQARDLDFMKLMVPDRWKELYENRESLVNLSNPEFCGKWKILKKLLRFWHSNGDKVLVFSHSVKLLKMLRHLFQNTSYNVSYLDGSLSYEDRQKEVDDFNSDPSQFVFLISTKAGGVGLNITSANKVVIMDPNWNPSYDLQAQDRAYRIGQVRDVEVFRLISSGTVEEIVYARQIYKQQQANIGYNASMERRYFKGVQNIKGQQGEIFGLHNLLTFHGDDIILRDIVNKTNVAEAKAGVNMIGVDMDDALNDEDNPLRVDDSAEDAAMSQLAALLASEENTSNRTNGGAKPKTDAVQAILASAGVQYTHENSEVVGSSKVEARLSRRAEETGNDVSVAEERLFLDSQYQQGINDVNEDGSAAFVYEYHPHAEVKLRQFCTMAKTFDFESATEFALIVEGWTQEQRRNCLDGFYKRRKDMLVAGEERRAQTALEREGGHESVYGARKLTDNPALSATGLGCTLTIKQEDENDDLDNYDLDG